MPAPGVSCRALEGAACHAQLWRHRGALHVAVVVKATFAMALDAPMTLAAPQPVLEADEHHGGSPAQSLRRPSELVPWRRLVDVTANGAACTAGGEPLPGTSVRLAVYRGSAMLLDKPLYVYGDRATPDGQPEPFTRVPLVYERARRSDANPTGRDPAKKAPNLFHPKDAAAAGGFGPISRYSKARRALLGGADRKALEGPIAELPDGFDGAYFQAAPADQQIAQLVGDEWVMIDGFDADHRRIASQLPQARAEALVTATTPEAAQAIGADGAWRYRPIRLSIDALHVDGDDGVVTCCWRGSFVVASEAALGQLRVVGGIGLGQQRMAWPAPQELAEVAPEPEREEPAPALSPDHTASVGGRTASPAVPFTGGSWDAPWGDPSIKPIPQVMGSGEVTYADRSGETVTLSPEERDRLRQALPFGPDPTEGTRAMSEEDAAAAAARPDAPFAIAGPGEGQPSEAPEGAPFAKRPARPVPRAPIGGTTMDLGGQAEERRQVVATPEAAVAASRFFHRLETQDRGPEEPEAEVETGPVLPPRTTEGIPIHRQTPLQLATIPWRHRPPRDSLTVIVKGTFDLVPGGVATPREDSDFTTGDLTWDDDDQRSLRYPSDYAYFKPRADVVLLGHAYAPWADERKTRRVGTATQVRLKFGGEEGFDRKLAVFGERHWKKALLTLAPTDPQPFEKMPLVYERAFGGPDWGPNPVGVGRGAETGPDGIARLPNLEQPDDLIDSPGDVPRPACFGPVHPLWGVRWRGLGTYDSGWLRDRWPYFPDDFDWSHFQCAPPEQRLETIAGDERFLITGMHPEHTHFEGELPGITPRCFMAVTGEDAGAPGAEIAFEKVELKLDTVVFDLDEMRLDLVWRGVVETTAEHAPEIQALFLMHDAPGEETTTDEAYRRLLVAAMDLDPVPDEPDEEATPANDVAPEEPEDPQAAELAALEARIEGMVAEQRAKLAELGFEPLGEAPPEPAPLDRGALSAQLKEAGVDDASIAGVLSALEPAEEEEVVEAPPVRARVVAALEAEVSLAGEDLQEGDLSDLDFSGRDLEGCDLRGCNLQRARLMGCNLRHALLDEADLTGADLRGANLEHASATRARLGDAVLDECRLEEADFREVQAEGASFQRAQGTSPQFSEGRLHRARFDGATIPEAHFDQSQLDGAKFDAADLTEALIFDATAAGASFREARLVDALCDGLAAAGANFHRAEATGSVWEESVLEEASFLEAKLDDASFVRAKLVRADLSAAEMREVRMKRVDATKARFVKSNLLNAQLEKSVLVGADFTGASLYGCEVWESETGGAIFIDALVAMSKLEGRG